VTLSAPDFDRPPRAVARIELPVPFAPNRQSWQRDVARALDKAKLGPLDPDAKRRRPRTEVGHPVEADPHLTDRLKAAAQRDRVEREVQELTARVRQRNESLARRFDRVLRILETWGYLDGWALTDAGQRLARLFHECDLLVVESLRAGLFDDVDAPTLAALVACCTYEHRSADAPPMPWFPSKDARQRWESIKMIGDELAAAEDAAGLPLSRRPDPTFAAIAWAWAKGERFADVVEDEELSGGDFVRNMKQLVDLLRQLAEVAPSEATRATAREAEERVLRGVVAASSAVRA
jgi:ATP-dependent RNA helicase HelY